MEIIFDTPMLYPNKSGKWSHLAAKDIKTLHEFAEKLGIDRCWFSNKRNKKQPHYDMSESLVELVKKHGAIQVQRKELFLFLETHFS